MDLDDMDKDQLRDVKDTVANAVNKYVEERREDIEELAEYGGGGPEGYKFAAHVLRQEYDKAAQMVDEDPETVEQDVGQLAEDIYDDAQQGREQASNFVEEALDVASPVIDVVRKGDYSSIPDALEESQERAYQRIGRYVLENTMGQAGEGLDLGELMDGLEGDEEALDDALGDVLDDLEGGGGGLGGIEDIFDIPDEADDSGAGYEEPVDDEPDTTVEDPVDDTTDTTGDTADAEDEALDDPANFPSDPRNAGPTADTYDETDDAADGALEAFMERDDVQDHYDQVLAVVDSIENPAGFAEARSTGDFYAEAVEHTSFDDADELREAHREAEKARSALLEKALDDLEPDDVREVQEHVDLIYGDR